jgi:AcrR family transcriptional regulator
MRSYTMRARAEAAAAASERILDAAEELFWEEPGREATLAEIAARAGVSVHSVIRRYGGRHGAVEASIQRAVERVEAERSEAAPGNLAGSVAVLVDHYEKTGDKVVTMLGAEDRLPLVKVAADRGRALHARWCGRIFASALAERRGAERRRLHAQLVAITDVYTWHLLRRVRGLSREQTERALVEMLESLIEGSRK